MHIFKGNSYPKIVQIEEVMVNAPMYSFILIYDNAANLHYKLQMKVPLGTELEGCRPIDKKQTKAKGYKILTHDIPAPLSALINTVVYSPAYYAYHRICNLSQDDYLMWYWTNKIPNFVNYCDPSFRSQRIKEPMVNLLPGQVGNNVQEVEELYLQLRIQHLSKAIENHRSFQGDEEFTRIMKHFRTVYTENLKKLKSSQFQEVCRALNALFGVQELNWQVTNLGLILSDFVFPYLPQRSFKISAQFTDEASALDALMQLRVALNSEDENDSIQPEDLSQEWSLSKSITINIADDKSYVPIELIQQNRGWSLSICISEFEEDAIKALTMICYQTAFQRAVEKNDAENMSLYFLAIIRNFGNTPVTQGNYTDETNTLLGLFKLIRDQDKANQNKTLTNYLISRLIKEELRWYYGPQIQTSLVHIIMAHLGNDKQYLTEEAELAFLLRKELFKNAFAIREEEGNQFIVDVNFHFLLTNTVPNQPQIRDVKDDNDTKKAIIEMLESLDKELGKLIDKFSNMGYVYRAKLDAYQDKRNYKIETLIARLQHAIDSNLSFKTDDFIDYADEIRPLYEFKQVLLQDVARIQKLASDIHYSAHSQSEKLAVLQRLEEEYVQLTKSMHDVPEIYSRALNAIEFARNHIYNFGDVLTEDDIFTFAGIVDYIRSVNTLIKEEVGRNPRSYSEDMKESKRIYSGALFERDSKRLKTGNTDNVLPSTDRPIDKKPN